MPMARSKIADAFTSSLFRDIDIRRGCGACASQRWITIIAASSLHSPFDSNFNVSVLVNPQVCMISAMLKLEWEPLAFRAVSAHWKISSHSCLMLAFMTVVTLGWSSLMYFVIPLLFATITVSLSNFSSVVWRA